ncbi:sideroflexin-4 isoform X2 [Colius striatus]|uniref:sideroflexin-4 isoform X2 n=1 Tax=Colius striatus TaxID=57412 RepID=UPI002B1CEAFF|nr:sideroflexin-4 isoform X2 [Colius striatus]
MDANLRFWREEGQTFFQRFLLWADALDPLLLLKPADEIRRNRLLLESSGKTEKPLQNDQTKQAFLLSLSSVHPDTDKIIPIMFRPPAFMPICLPLVVASSLQLQAKQAFFCQFAFHMYNTGFALVHGNGTAKCEDYILQQKQIFCGLGAISYAAVVGALPLIFMNRYTLKSPLAELVVKKLLPAPLLGLMSAFTVAVVRSPEFENGIEVMDRNGKIVGVSQKAGEKSKICKNSTNFGFSETACADISTDRDAASLAQYVLAVWGDKASRPGTGNSGIYRRNSVVLQQGNLETGFNISPCALTEVNPECINKFQWPT